ncbi:MAG: Xaa-Pro peptidase family protein [Actinomycetota bacterium]|nr:Xaa-Pro peptidase family protein [Actinomycetota bacterium]
MPDVLIYADTSRSPELRHEVPLTVPDPFLYAERDGTRFAVASSLEVPRLRELRGLEVLALDELGMDELIAQGMSREKISLELSARACRHIGITNAVVPAAFPLELADHLRANGIELQADRSFFDERRRVKTAAELAGIRRAQAAAEAGMAAARELLRRAEPNGATVMLDGGPLTCETLKAAIEQAFVEHGATAEEFIVSHGPQSAVGHEMGSGPIAPNEPIVIDLWPRDRESACYADMTRTFVVGEPSAELVEWQRLCREALERAISEIRPGVLGRALYDGTCEIFERDGYPTQRTKEPGTVLEDGFFHGLGHGVGLEVHEDPNMGILGQKELVAGDVVTVEPGLYRSGYGGCRLEDLVVVTEHGAENLTDFPYDLEP